MAVRRDIPARKTTAEYPLGFLRLYIDDVADAVELMQSRAGEVVVTAGRAQLEAADDLTDATRVELRNVRIESVDPSVVVSLGYEAAAVVAFDDSDEARLLADDVARLLGERHTKMPVGKARKASIPMLALLVFGVPLVVAGFQGFVPGARQLDLWADATALVGLLVVGILGYFLFR